MIDDKRFTEIVSTQKIVDNYTGIEYDGLVDDRLLSVINNLHDSREHLKKIRAKQEDEIDLLRDAVHGLLAIEELRRLGIIFDTWE